MGKSKWRPPEKVRIRGRSAHRRGATRHRVEALREDAALANSTGNSTKRQMPNPAEPKVIFAPEYVHDPEADKRMAEARRHDFMKTISADAAAIAGETEGGAFEAAVLLLAMIKRERSDITLLCRLTGLPYHNILVMLVRAKLAGILFDDGSFNFYVLQGCEGQATAAVAEVLLTGCLAGTFIRTIEDKWRTGDQSDPDGANWPQHLAHGLIDCIGRRYVFQRADETGVATASDNLACAET